MLRSLKSLGVASCFGLTLTKGMVGYPSPVRGIMFSLSSVHRSCNQELIQHCFDKLFTMDDVHHFVGIMRQRKYKVSL